MPATAPLPTHPKPVQLRVALAGTKPLAVERLRAELAHALAQLAGCTVAFLSKPSEGEPAESAPPATTFPRACSSPQPPSPPSGPPPRVHWQLCNASAWLLAPHGAADPPAADAVLLLSEPSAAALPPADEAALRQALQRLGWAYTVLASAPGAAPHALQQAAWSALAHLPRLPRGVRDAMLLGAPSAAAKSGGAPKAAAFHTWCERCGDPACERRLFAALTARPQPWAAAPPPR